MFKLIKDHQAEIAFTLGITLAGVLLFPDFFIKPKSPAVQVIHIYHHLW